MKNSLKMTPYLFINIISFYFLPLLIKGSGTEILIMLGLPAICFLISLFYGIKNGFDFIYPLIVAILFAPTVFIFYNKSACPYILFYGLASLFGVFIGNLFFQSVAERKLK